MAQKQPNGKKIAAAVTASALAATIALGSTFAFTDLGQNAINWWSHTVTGDSIKNEELLVPDQTAGKDTPYDGEIITTKTGVLLHDDFAGGTNKDVYAENLSDTNEPMLIRMRFKEWYFIQEPNAQGTPENPKVYKDGATVTNLNDPESWPIHSFNGDTTVAGNADTAAVDDGGIEHDSYAWAMTGGAKNYYIAQTGAMTSGTYALTATEGDPPVAVAKDYDTAAAGAAGTKSTAAAQAPILLEAYNTAVADVAAGTNDAADDALITAFNNGCWVIDNTSADGWCYWSQLLAPGAATNKLLDSVNYSGGAINDNYRINVEMQAASKAQKDIFYAAAETDDLDANPVAKALTDSIFAGTPIDPAAVIKGENGEFYQSLNHNVFVKVQKVGANYFAIDGELPIIAGRDGKPGSTDDMLLSGRTSAMGGQIAATNVDIVNWTYQIVGANEKYTVTAGIDGALGTYDDVIKSSDAALGTYNINSATEKENVGWQYLGGSVDNMLLTTEYVLDNVLFNNAGGDSLYTGSVLDSKMNQIYTDMGGATMTAVKSNSNVSMAKSTCSNAYVCTNPAHTTDVAHDTISCTYKYAAYNTTAPNQVNITRSFFAPSIDELATAFGESNSPAVAGSRSAQGANVYLNPVAGDFSAGKNFAYVSDAYIDGDGNKVVQTFYWLRDPGSSTRNCSIVDTAGSFLCNTAVNSWFLGARPACYATLVA